MMEEEKELREHRSKPEAEKKEADSGMILGMCLGMAIGAGIGALTKNLAVWMSVGMCLGMCVGMAFDSQKKNEQNDGDDQPKA